MRAAPHSGAQRPPGPRANGGRLPCPDRAAAASLLGVPAVVLLCRRPQHLHVDEAVAWFWRELREVAADPRISEIALWPLVQAGPRLPRRWDWLLRVGVVPATPGHVLGAGPCGALLADLQLLGMDPTVLVCADVELRP